MFAARPITKGFKYSDGSSKILLQSCFQLTILVAVILWYYIICHYMIRNKLKTFIHSFNLPRIRNGPGRMCFANRTASLMSVRPPHYRDCHEGTSQKGLESWSCAQTTHYCFRARLCYWLFWNCDELGRVCVHAYGCLVSTRTRTDGVTWAMMVLAHCPIYSFVSSIPV